MRTINTLDITRKEQSMITQHRYNLQGDVTYEGLSTDDKPTEDVAPNALFLELDTGDFFFWEKDAQMWVKVGG